MKKQFFLAYGLTIGSDFFLPELTLAPDNNCQSDVVIRTGRLKVPILKPTDSKLLCAIEHDYAYLHWDEAGTVLVREGQEIIVDPIDGVNEQILRILLLGAAFGLLLHQRGLMVVHGNSVNINGKGVCFIGNRGFGKSTISAGLYFKGYPVVSDDVTAISLDDPESAYLIPGYARLKLWTDSVEALGLKSQHLSLVHPQYEKREYLISESLDTKPVPLNYIYVLSSSEKSAIESMSPTEAMVKIMQNSYCTRFGKEMYKTLSTVEHFQQCSSLVNRSQVFSLKRTNDLTSLPELIGLIEEHTSKL